jgi:hypothetical protein
MRDILSGFGPDSPDDQQPRARNGGEMPVKPIPYKPPVGPTTFSHEGPGLADHTNHGCCGTNGKY